VAATSPVPPFSSSRTPAGKPLAIAPDAPNDSIVPSVTLQLAASAGTCLIAGLFLPCPASGAVVGVMTTVVGDKFGPKRSAMLWPAVAGAGVQAIGVAATVVAYYGLLLWPLSSGRSPNSTDIGIAIGSLFVGSALTLGATVVVPTIVYHVTAVPKEAGDTGEGMPDALTPRKLRPPTPDNIVPMPPPAVPPPALPPPALPAQQTPPESPPTPLPSTTMPPPLLQDPASGE
jgi:hypothetical protein